jgi:hypothetical protein
VLDGNHSISTTPMEKDLATNTLQQGSEGSGTETPISSDLTMKKEHVDLQEDLLFDSSNSVAIEPIGFSVKRFLSFHNGDNREFQSAGIVLENITVEGSGTGVSCP